MAIDLDNVRDATRHLMTCCRCDSPMMVCMSGLACEKPNCGMLVPTGYKPSDVARAWPDRAVKYLSYATRTRNDLLTKEKVKPANGQMELPE